MTATEMSRTDAMFTGLTKPWNFIADFARQQQAWAMDSACTLLQGFEALRKLQMDAAHEAHARHAAAAGAVRDGCDTMQLARLQAELLRDDVGGALRYWQQMAATAMEMQTKMAGRATRMVNSEAVLEATANLDKFESVLESASPVKPGFFATRPRKAAVRRRATQ